ncbi:hypothetical protein A3K80_01350 [Candidatus Bathyarchaeota archaeon RBG_13_38_9]|nr:MAG: hypothetical protein A3K80_01350 [Candidatus Bathyarchaeota archaeon RBG_13_38_9]
MFHRTIPNELKLILAAATIIFLFSVWEHLPPIIPHHYTDITSIYWREGIGTGEHLIPYFEFEFEYPIIIGLIVYLTSSVRLFIKDFATAMSYFMIANSAILYAFTVGIIIVLYRILERVKGDSSRFWKCFLITPSFIMFIVFNWDIIAIFFSTLALYYFLKGERLKADLSIGMGIAAKLYPAMLIPVFMIEEKNWRERIKHLAIPLIFFGLLNLPFMILNFETWFGTYMFHTEWGIENSWLVFFFDKYDQNSHYVGLVVLLYFVFKGLMESGRRDYGSSQMRIINRALLVSIAWLLGNYVVTPQMALMLLPFYVLIPTVPILMIYLAEIFNALIIVMWFISKKIFLEDPTLPSSPVQWAALARQLLWLLLFVYMIYPEKIKVWSSKIFKKNLD